MNAPVVAFRGTLPEARKIEEPVKDHWVQLLGKVDAYCMAPPESRTYGFLEELSSRYAARSSHLLAADDQSEAHLAMARAGLAFLHTLRVCDLHQHQDEQTQLDRALGYVKAALAEVPTERSQVLRHALDVYVQQQMEGLLHRMRQQQEPEQVRELITHAAMSMLRASAAMHAPRHWDSDPAVTRTAEAIVRMAGSLRGMPTLTDDAHIKGYASACTRWLAQQSESDFDDFLRSQAMFKQIDPTLLTRQQFEKAIAAASDLELAGPAAAGLLLRSIGEPNARSAETERQIAKALVLCGARSYSAERAFETGEARVFALRVQSDQVAREELGATLGEIGARSVRGLDLNLWRPLEMAEHFVPREFADQALVEGMRREVAASMSELSPAGVLSRFSPIMPPRAWQALVVTMRKYLPPEPVELGKRAPLRKAQGFDRCCSVLAIEGWVTLGSVIDPGGLDVDSPHLLAMLKQKPHRLAEIKDYDTFMVVAANAGIDVQVDDRVIRHSEPDGAAPRERARGG